MPITPEQRERLDQLMNERRLELGLTWREVAARAGRSYEALRQLRTGPGGINELTAVQFARALSWEPRSILDVLSGGSPATADDVPVADDRPPVVREHWADAGVRELWMIQTIPADARTNLIVNLLEQQETREPPARAAG
jgi:hypothetical protein